MRKFLVVLISILICIPQIAYADERYIELTEYPYSTHVLGDDLVVCGKTNLPYVTIGLFYPKDENYPGTAIFIDTITKAEFENGYTIHTGTLSRLWPEGNWTVRAQYDSVSDFITVPMSEKPLFNRKIRIADYYCNELISLNTYSTRGLFVKNNVIEIPLEDGSKIKVFSWNNLSPAKEGESRVYIAFYKEGHLVDIHTLSGTLSCYGNHVAIASDDKKIKIFYWNESMIPR